MNTARITRITRIAISAALLACLSGMGPPDPADTVERGNKQLAEDRSGGFACAQQCVSDVIADGFVNVFDLLALLNGWGVCVPCPPTICSGDFNADCSINVFDLLELLADWGPCPAPDNDLCVNASSLNFDGPIQFCTIDAGTEADPPATCAFCCDDPQVHKDVWYTFNSNQFSAQTFIQLDTCSADFDTKITVYRWSGFSACNCDSLAAAQVVACNDDASLATCNLQSRVQFQLVNNSCYAVRVGGYNGQSGSGTLRAHRLYQGDECFNAVDLGIVTASTVLTVTGDSAQTNYPYSPGITVPQAPCTSFPDGRDIWYKFQIGCGGNVIGAANTCDPATNYDTILTLYRGTCDGLIELACNDDYAGNPACLLNGLVRKSLVDLPNATQSGFYYLRLSGYQGATGNYRINIGLSCIN